MPSPGQVVPNWPFAGFVTSLTSHCAAPRHTHAGLSDVRCYRDSWAVVARSSGRGRAGWSETGEMGASARSCRAGRQRWKLTSRGGDAAGEDGRAHRHGPTCAGAVCTVLFVWACARSAARRYTHPRCGKLVSITAIPKKTRALKSARMTTCPFCDSDSGRSNFVDLHAHRQNGVGHCTGEPLSISIVLYWRVNRN